MILGMRKRWTCVPLPFPPIRFHKNVVILLVANPPTIAEAADSADRFRFHKYEVFFPHPWLRESETERTFFCLFPFGLAEIIGNQ